jgi:hypothetical protein
MATRFLENNKNGALYWIFGYDIDKSKDWDIMYNLLVKHGNWFLIFTFPHKYSCSPFSIGTSSPYP